MKKMEVNWLRAMRTHTWAWVGINPEEGVQVTIEGTDTMSTVTPEHRLSCQVSICYLLDCEPIVIVQVYKLFLGGNFVLYLPCEAPESVAVFLKLCFK